MKPISQTCEHSHPPIRSSPFSRVTSRVLDPESFESKISKFGTQTQLSSFKRGRNKVRQDETISPEIRDGKPNEAICGSNEWSHVCLSAIPENWSAMQDKMRRQSHERSETRMSRNEPKPSREEQQGPASSSGHRCTWRCRCSSGP